MSKTSRFTGKPGARIEDGRSGSENRGSGIEDRLKKLENNNNKKNKSWIVVMWADRR